jgi:DNA modification methylase
MKIENSEVTLYNENCFDTFQNIPDSSIDTIVTDPPYGISFSDTHSNVSDWDNLSDSDYRTLLENFLTECSRVLRPHGQGWMFFAPTKIDTIVSVFKAFEKQGLIQRNLENWLIYARNKGRGSTKKLKSLREDIIHFSKGKYDIWNYVEYYRRVLCPYVKDGKPRGWAVDITTGEPARFTGAGNVLYFSAPNYTSKFEKMIHSCQKPVLLNAMLIMLSTKKGDTVLDPFMGSGSSGVAAVLCDRNYIGVEAEPEVYDKAKNWISHIDWKEAEQYVKRHISSTEKGFKFGIDSRSILPKNG